MSPRRVPGQRAIIDRRALAEEIAALHEAGGERARPAIVKALRDGVEDIYPGDVAQEWLERWRDNPKALERELAQGAL